MDSYCVKHFDQKAVGNCGTCNKPYCAECLDVETAQPICPNCKQLKAKESVKAALGGGGGALNFKGAGMDDDPLGLFAGKPATPKASPSTGTPMGGGPKVEPPKPMPSSAPSTPAPSAFDMGAPVPKPSPAPPMPSPTPQAAPFTGSPSMGGGPQASPSTGLPMGGGPKPSTPGAMTPGAFDLGSLGTRIPSTGASKPVMPPIPSGPKPSLDLDSMGTAPPPLKPSFPTPSAAPVPSAVNSTPSFGMDAGSPPPPKKKGPNMAKIWAKYLVRHSYEMFDPLAQKLHVPTYVFLALLVLVLGGGIAGILSVVNKPKVALVDRIQPLHFIQVSSAQISEMDITSYTELLNQIKAMGFAPILQATIPQLPSSNFFDVYTKGDAGTYAEILKMPGQITPHLSFVTVFSNGVWYSTNGWTGKNQELEFLKSEFYPADNADQLYVKHIQGVEKARQEKDWQVQSMGENRYMAALSDHIRWFLDKKNLQAYQADFALWH